MSTCMFLIRDLHTVDPLRNDLVSFVKSVKLGVDFHPVDYMLTHYQIRLQTWDFVFSLSDSFDDTFCDLLVSPEGVPFNGIEHPLPFKERMAAIQHTAEIALKYSDEVELFLSDDNPNLADFTDFNVSCQNVAEILCQQYELLRLPFEIRSLPVKAYILCDIPSAHMKIHKTGDG